MKKNRSKYRMPSESEQEIAEAYVLKRKINRPTITIKKAVVVVLIFVFATSWFTALAYTLVYEYLLHMPLWVQTFFNFSSFLFALFLFLIIIWIEMLFCFRYAIIGAVKLYQRYAPEEIRRRCLFMPTCSEYTIMAVRKYGGIIGLCKSYYRLKYRCRGTIYMVDYP